MAKEMANLIYVVIYTAAAHGIPLGAVWHEVHRSNMAKVGPAKGALLEAKEQALSFYVIAWGAKRMVSIKKGLAQAGRAAGLPMRVTPHMLRHSAAVHMAQRGASMDEISQFLGHSNVEVTRKLYARFSPHS